ADCPVCGRRARLEVVEKDSGKVVFVCQAGCDRELIREWIGLPWSAYFDDVSYSEPQGRSALDLVLRALDGTRWTITTHDFGDDWELALAVEIVEQLLPARYRVRHLLRLRSGKRIDWAEFPLTASYIQAAARKLGHRVGEHRAAGLIHVLVSHGLIERVETLQ